ncbi:type II CAAX endopeptidase family protein [Streptococcus pluranimalium]|uniref:CPBP family intramembrane glutamic endopeptidase n=1 Tax=Streptococcus pluranimalium TaxID=82348 RepID=UPI003467386E
MLESVIDAKKRSAKNFSWWSAPLLGYGLLVTGEIFGIIALLWVPFAFPQVLSDEYLMLLVELFTFAFIAIVVIAWARLQEKSPWQGLGLSRANAFKEFIKGWAFGAVVLIVCVLLMMAVGVVTIEAIDFSMKTWLKFIPLLLAWSIQGTTEEILCRGWIFTTISAKNNIPLGILMSSLFFTAIHLGNDGISLIPLLDLFIFAVLACLVMLKTNNLWVISGFHAAWNCFQGNVFAFPVSGTTTGDAFIHVSSHGPAWLSGVPFGVEGSIISVIVQLAIVAWLAYDLFVKPKQVLQK